MKHELRKNLVERVYLTNDELSNVERSVLLHEHLRRYGSIRRFCFGKVLDLACGVGYGTFLLASNPHVEKVIGVDVDKNAIAWAKKEFSGEKISYRLSNANDIKEKFDTLVCLETIEHIKDKRIIPDLVERCDIDNLIVSFPDKITTHYNKYHYHDFVRQEICDLFPNHIAYHILRFVDSTSILFTRLPKKAPRNIFRNIIDLR